MPRKKTEQKTPANARNVMQNPARGKNSGAQTNGQFERGPHSGRGSFSGAGAPPRMTK
jgi:hypothetical protein